MSGSQEISECAKFSGRDRDLCEGRGLDGRPDPPAYVSQAFREREKLAPLPPRPTGASISAVSYDGIQVTGTPAVFVHRPPVEIQGPGTELKKVFDSMRLSIHGVQSNGCNPCRGMMDRMNAIGVAGCREQIDSLADELRTRAKEFSYAQWVQAGVMAAAAGMALKLSWLDPFPGLIREAIERAAVTAIKLPVIQPPAAPKPITWAYGITTTPVRRYTLLPSTLRSLAAAGFDRPSLFVDGCNDSGLYAEFGLDVACRYPAIGNFSNWLLSALAIYQQNPFADFYAVFEDDLLISLGVREYLERTATDQKAYYNLYASHQAPTRPPETVGWWKPPQSPTRGAGWGAVALVFARDVFRTLIGDPDMIDNPKCGDRARATGFVDGAIVTVLNKHGIFELRHSPSLVQHVGTVSVMGHGFQTARSFRGEAFDCRTLLEK